MYYTSLSPNYKATQWYFGMNRWILECWWEFADGLIWLVWGWGDILHVFVRRMSLFRRMSLSFFNARLMYPGSEVKGSTTYGLNGRDLSRWVKELFDTIGLALQHHAEFVLVVPITPWIDVYTPDFMMDFERIEAARSGDQVRNHILALEDDAVERAHLILP